ncbi:MAG TPA: aminotransferase class IV [Terriglobales bacterium]|jgi:4-amino-4-deoxychorismate lyase|nr:aminotransferase class IV [Terriglobales bacterium]
MTDVPKTTIFTTEGAIARLRESVHAKATNFYAMYSSVFGGIVTDPALMVLPLDDHMVHRGHAVFDTATLIHGSLYQLDPHLDRLIRSADSARIRLPFPRERLRQIILETAAVSRRREGSVRYWLSAGPGGYGLGPAECVGSSFYVIVFKQEAYPESYYQKGVKLITSQVPIKPPLFARIKSTNYLPNVLVVLEAKDRGVDNGIFIDPRGMVAESSNMNVAFVTKDRIFRHPPFEAILSGITIQRVLDFAQRLVQQDALNAVRLADIPVEEGRAAAEMMLVGSSIKVAPVVEWDGRKIGDGKPGPVAKKLLELWNEDTTAAQDQLVAVPYDDGK